MIVIKDCHRSASAFYRPFTGAGFLRDASHGNTFNVRATYHAETEARINYLVDQQGMKSIAILYQDDGFGRVGPAAVEAAGKDLTRESYLKALRL